MRKPYSRDLREAALRRLDAGDPVGEVARVFGVHRTTLLRWRQKRSSGDLGCPRARRAPKIGPAERPSLVAQVAATPDATLREHCTAWEAATGVRVSEATMCRALRKARLTLKKRR